jgi:hypothetical protein
MEKFIDSESTIRFRIIYTFPFKILNCASLQTHFSTVYTIVHNKFKNYEIGMRQIKITKLVVDSE